MSADPAVWASGAPGAGVAPYTLVVLAKSPRPGRVKTRLTPVFTPQEAAALAAASLRDTLDAVEAAGSRETVLAWEGPTPSWLPQHARILPQRGDGLDERLEAVFADLLGGATGPAPLDADRDRGEGRPTLLVGMDTPQVSAELLRHAWGDADAVLGLSPDGGFWAIGFRRYVPGAILGVPMSTDGTGAAQLERLRSLGLSVLVLPELLDVDEPADAARVAALAPQTRFSRLHARILESRRTGDVFDALHSGGSVDVVGRSGDQGGDRPLDPSAWLTMSDADVLLVSRCEAPVLDVGCGPGRFVEALSQQGMVALGVDVSRAAVTSVTSRGGSALLRDVHQRLPAEGRWGTVLLADGNIGIGGDPLALLRRCRELLRPGAMALVEVDPDDVDEVTTLSVRTTDGVVASPVPWAVLGARRLVELAAEVGFVAVEEWRVQERAFVALRHAG